MKKINLKSMLFLIFLILILNQISFAKEVIRVAISKGYKERIVILFPVTYNDDFDSSLFSEMDELLHIDLKLSGKISFPSNQNPINALAKKESFIKTNIDEWRNLGGEFLLKTEISKNLGAPQMKWKLFDLISGKLLKEGNKTSSMKSFRDLGHKTSEDILMALTGEKGLGGTRIAFVSDKNKVKTIFSCDIEGKDVTQLVFEKSLTLSPCFGPNRESLVYTSYQNINPGVFIKYFSSNKVESVSIMPGLNANGKINSKNEVVFTASRDGNPEIYKKNILSGKLTRLTRRYGVDATPCWSSDGKRIAFVSSTSSYPQIYVMNSEGGDIMQLTKTANYNASPDFSPNGRYLAFSSEIRGRLNILLHDFQMADTNFIVSGMGNSDSPSFSPDSKYIAFASDKGGTWNIYIVDIETREITKITRNLGNCSNPSWK